ncbi:LysE family translocator [Yoonia litorea]|uniref:Threonine/homoserine/homoserine lactone efflux protein n=1 Tax=Yoonia litorea TaxID=1123755 RepID=A0A1I6LC89_9RHOB|nr:LysE family translocator [Yoonia litorea]SFS01047.1 Threonine/homoserine/homoserine lactone efflux protein [Yoonia litorea]
MDILSLLPLLLAFLVVAVSPGPANIAVATIATIATIAMSNGRASAMRFGLGLGVGLAFWGLIAATGLGAILQGSAVFLTGLKLFGGCYLLWLAWKSLKSARSGNTIAKTAIKGQRWFLRGLLLNLSNPKAVVAWMAALSMGLGQGAEWQMIAIATLLCMAIGFANYVGHAYAFSISGFMAAYARLRAVIEGTVALFFAGGGLGLIRSALSR